MGNEFWNNIFLSYKIYQIQISQEYEQIYMKQLLYICIFLYKIRQNNNLGLVIHNINICYLNYIF